MASTHTPVAAEWIEVFHSKPSMARCYLLEKLPSGEFTSPSRQNQLRDASHIRDGFRVYRLPSRHIEFVLTNGSDRLWEDNHGRNYIIDAPGRYVVEHGIRRVGESNPRESIQMMCRPDDQWIHILFRADLWEACLCNYKVDDKEWTTAPGEPMKTVVNPHQDGKWFELQVKGNQIEFAFNDGGEIWDSNLRNNYKIGHPGKYIVTGGKVVYIEPADLDKEKPIKDMFQPSSTVPGVRNTAPTSTKAPQPVS